MEKYMKIAYKEAEKAYKNGEVPVGAVIVKDNVVVSKAYNKKEKYQCTTKHAEIIAIEKACKKLKTWHLDDCEIYITMEPCMMCTGAIIQSRIKKIYYGAESTDNNNHKIFQDICNSSDNNDKINYYHNIMQLECSELLRKFFVSKR